MESSRVTAIRVCGLATLVVVVLALAGLASLAFGMSGLPVLRATLGMAVLVAFAAFLLANITNRDTAKAVCIGAIGFAAVGAVLRLFAVAGELTTPGIVDAGFAFAVALLFVPLVRSVWSRSGDAQSAA
jgi:predicted branched-subunit amino acid permease